MPSLDTISALVIHYGYFLMFPVAVLEGPIITVIAAFLASEGYFNPVVVFVVLVVADIVGDVFYYGLGRLGKVAVLERWGHRIGVTPERLAEAELHFTEQGGKTILFGKWTHSAGFIVLVAAGAAKMPLKEFVWYNFLGTLPKTLVFMVVGYFLGFAYTQIDSYLTKITFVLFVGICVGVFIWYKKRTKKSMSETQ